MIFSETVFAEHDTDTVHMTYTRANQRKHENGWVSKLWSLGLCLNNVSLCIDFTENTSVFSNNSEI